MREVQDAVDHAEHGIDVVRHEEDARTAVASAAVDELGDAALVREVETREGLVAQQEQRVVGERLPDAQSLLLAAREGADRAVDANPVAPTASISASTRAFVAREGNGSPNRCPSTPSVTRSRPRRGVPAGTIRCCGM